MIKILMPFVLGLFNSFAHAMPVVSGFDDVLRQAEVQNLVGATMKLFQDDKDFEGMPELYEALTRNSTAPGGDSLTIISGITHLYESRAKSFLQKEKYPPFQLRFRNWLKDWSIEEFKLREIRHGFDLGPRQKFIFVFDNSTPSLEISHRLRTEFPERVLAIYLRQTVSRESEPGIEPFVTALDIALSEQKNARLTEKDVQRVLAVLLKQEQLEHIIPLYADCPTNWNSCKNVTPLNAESCAKFQRKLKAYCSARQ